MSTETGQSEKAAMAGVKSSDLLAIDFLLKLLAAYNHLDSWELGRIVGQPKTGNGVVRQSSEIFGHEYVDQKEGAYGQYGMLWVPIGCEEENYLLIYFSC